MAVSFKGVTASAKADTGIASRVAACIVATVGTVAYAVMQGFQAELELWEAGKAASHKRRMGEELTTEEETSADALEMAIVSFGKELGRVKLLPSTVTPVIDKVEQPERPATKEELNFAVRLTWRLACHLWSIREVEWQSTVDQHWYRPVGVMLTRRGGNIHDGWSLDTFASGLGTTEGGRFLPDWVRANAVIVALQGLKVIDGWSNRFNLHGVTTKSSATAAATKRGKAKGYALK